MKRYLSCVFIAGILSFLLLFGSLSQTVAVEEVSMKNAKPVWAKGRQKEMNMTMGFRTEFEKPQSSPVVLRVAASTIYRVWLNGSFLGHGPARAAHGFYRVDEWNISDKLAAGKNLLAIEVAGYNANSYYLLDQPSFLQAELTAGGKAIAATVPSDGGMDVASGVVPFAASVLDYRVQKVQRYSFQRPFSECYRLTPDSQSLLRDQSALFKIIETEDCGSKQLLKRGVLYPDFAIQMPVRRVAAGRIVRLDKPPELHRNQVVGPELKGFPEAELEVTPSLDAQYFESKDIKPLDQSYDSNVELKLAEGDFEILEMKKNLTGFICSTITCDKKTRLWFIFDELLTGSDVNFMRLGWTNIIEYELAPGTYRLEAIEPYTFRYLKIVCREGDCRVADVYLREFAHPPIAASFHCNDERANRLFEAGVESFRQNSLDIFMDCPSRERGGWLCDSFFTSRVESVLTGSTRIERNFIENFMLPKKFDNLPEGMLPMCYPADHYNKCFIPNWAMFFVLQLDEYYLRSGDKAMVEALRTRVIKLFDYFKQFENEDGLLEKLPGWIFVDYSEANNFVQDVNYPTNMLYAAALDTAGRLYNEPSLVEKADRIREVIRRQSFDGEFFVDNAVRKDGKLQVTRNRSEACQDYAFFFNVAMPHTHPELWEKLCNDFGPKREKTKKFADVYKAQAFVGNMFRVELLSRERRSRQILEETLSDYMNMVDLTGTLWEGVGSCNHGYPSHICRTLLRDVLGMRRVDAVNKKVEICFPDLDLTSCCGTIPTSDGPVELDWKKQDDRLSYRLVVPKGYIVEIKNNSGKQLVVSQCDN